MITFSKLGRYGRIGNQMFQIASTIGLAVKHGYTYGFPQWVNHDQQERFGAGFDPFMEPFFKHPLPKVPEGYHFQPRNIKWGYHDLQIDDGADLVGHMQSEKYFKHCEDLIRHTFEFAVPLRRMPGTLAIHFRGGDYGDDYHPHCSADYYARALRLVGANRKAYIFSDSPELAKKVIGHPDAVILDDAHPMQHMMIMASCEAHIIANSTFSWWGAWLSGSKHVVAPSQWFGPSANLSSKDIYAEGWHVV